MIEARKATFGKLWPHEGKKGWKCKTKQVGWIGSLLDKKRIDRGIVGRCRLEIHAYTRI